MPMPHSLATTTSFTQSGYSVIKNEGSAQPVLVLSYPSSNVTTAHLTTTDRSATGEYCITSDVCVCVCVCCAYMCVYV